MKLSWKELAVTALVGAGCVAVYAALTRPKRKEAEDRQLGNEEKLRELAARVKYLQAREAQLTRTLTERPAPAVVAPTPVVAAPPAIVTAPVAVEAAPVIPVEMPLFAEEPLAAEPLALEEETAPAELPEAADEAAPAPDALQQTTLAALTAAASVFLNKKTRIRSIKLKPTPDSAGAWAQQGRVLVLSSHNLQPRR